MTEHPKQSLRFHDGIGDVLQERRSHRLSLLRPLWVSLTIGCVTILIFVAALNAVSGNSAGDVSAVAATLRQGAVQWIAVWLWKL
ncbi:hypothetical protein EBZ35_07240, partial [bacterium]|nr:hypothetical protein [bacterium]